jgi:hypothetical protein
LTHDETLRLVSAAIARPVAYVPVPESVAVRSLKDMGMDDWTIGIMSSLKQVMAAGCAAAVSIDLQTVTGHAPRANRDTA